MKYFEKDGKKYLFRSKFKEFNNPYCLSNNIKNEIDERLEKNIEFMKKSFISINYEKFFSLFDCSISANIQPKLYHAELYNRIETLRIFAKELGFDTPIFITLTPPTIYKPLKQIKMGKTNFIKLVDNPNFVYDENFITLSRDYISQSWRKFLNQRIFKDIKTEFKQNLIYLKVYEPFLDGSCHCHILAFIPAKFKVRFINLVKGYFKTRTDIKSEFDDNAGGVISYLLKYVLKSFKHKDTLKLNLVSYWYIAFKIRRFSTSKLLIPLHYYRKIKSNEKFRNLYEMTNLYKNGLITCDLISNLQKSIYDEKLLSTDYKIDAILVGLINDLDYVEYHIAYKKSDKVTLYFYNPSSKVPLKISLNPVLKKYKFYPFADIDSIRKRANKKSIYDKSFVEMRDLELIELYKKFVYAKIFETENLQYIANFENELIRRGYGFITGKKSLHNLNDIETIEQDLYNRELREIPF